MTAELQTIWTQRLKVSQAIIADFCDRWKIVEFARFGSVLRDDFRVAGRLPRCGTTSALRDDFRPDSDIDVLIRFASQSGWNLFHLMNLKRELETLFGREVDLLEKRQLQNPFRRAEILKTHQVIYTNE